MSARNAASRTVATCRHFRRIAASRFGIRALILLILAQFPLGTSFLTPVYCAPPVLQLPAQVTANSSFQSKQRQELPPLPLFGQIRLSSHSPSCFASIPTPEVTTPNASGAMKRACYSQTEWRALLHQTLSAQRPRPPSHHTLTPSSLAATLVAFQSPRIRARLEVLRLELLEKLRPLDTFGLWREVILGDASFASGSELLRTFGFVHLASATGIHLAAAHRLTQAAFSPLNRGLLRWVSPILLSGFLWILAGGRPGMLRGLAIFVLRDLARLSGARFKWYAPLLVVLAFEAAFRGISFFHRQGSLAVALSSLHQPSSPGGFLDAALWGRLIYVLAVGGSLLALEAYRRPKGARYGSHQMHLAMAIGSWGACAIAEGFHSHSISLVTPLLSLITLPLFIILLYPTILALVFLSLALPPSADRSVAEPLKFAIDVGDSVLSHAYIWIAKFRLLWLVSSPYEVSSLGWGAAMLSIAFFLVLRQARPRLAWTLCLGVAAIFIAFRLFSAVTPPRVLGVGLQKTPAARIRQLDVGQGDSAWYLDEGGKLGWIDFGSCAKTSESKWLSHFAKTGASSVSWAWISHLDADHSGGWPRAAHMLPIQCVATPAPQLNRATHTNGLLGTRFSSPSQCIPQAFTWSRPFQPTSRRHAKAKPSEPNAIAPNRGMGALLLPLGADQYFVSLGDMNADDELRLLPWLLKTSMRPTGTYASRKFILKLSHHGSQTSSSAEFLKALAPKEAWISAGFRNSYGHPSPVVLSRLRSLGIPWRSTVLSGDLELRAPQSSSRPPSTTSTSPVIQEASSDSKNRIAADTSRGSPTLPSGNVAPRLE